MGGYSGSSTVVAVLDEYDDRRVLFADIDGSRDNSGLDTIMCAKHSFPPPENGMLDNAPVQHASLDIADELAKLAALRDRGVLTPAEFDRQKAVLLAR